jgi:hypothetical protein
MDFFGIEDKVIEVMRGDNTVFLIGSGISGLDSWSGFIENFASYCEECGFDITEARAILVQEKFDVATDRLIELVGQNGFEKYIESLQAYKDAVPNEVHHTLLNFPSNKFLTTNIDPLIEKSFITKYKRPLETCLNPDRAKLPQIYSRALKEFVYKYHGCVFSPSSVVFGTEHYNQIMYNDRFVKNTLATIFQTFDVVLIGFGCTDYDFVHIQNEIKSITQEHTKDVYAFLPSVSEAQEHRFRKRNIRPISYDLVGGEHKLNDALLYILNKIYQQQTDDLRGLIEELPAQIVKEDLDEQLLNIQQQILPIDKRCLGYIKALNSLSKTQLYEFVCDDVSPDYIDARLQTYVHANLITETRNAYLPSDHPIMTQAALWIEDEMIERFLGELDEQ